jgi:hypothetical protein
MDYIQFRILLRMTVIQYRINVLDVKSRHSVGGLVAVATSWNTQGSNPVMKKIYFSSSNRPDRLWSLSNLRFNWYRVSFPGQGNRGVKLSAPSHSVEVKWVEVYLCFSYMPSWWEGPGVTLHITPFWYPPKPTQLPFQRVIEYFPHGVWWRGCDSTMWSTFTGKIKNAWSHANTPSCSISWCLIKRHNNFTFNAA